MSPVKIPQEEKIKCYFQINQNRVHHNKPFLKEFLKYFWKKKYYKGQAYTNKEKQRKPINMWVNLNKH